MEIAGGMSCAQSQPEPPPGSNESLEFVSRSRASCWGASPPRSPSCFLRRRCRRPQCSAITKERRPAPKAVYPIYWLFTLAFVALLAIFGGADARMPTSPVDWLTALSLIRFTGGAPPSGCLDPVLRSCLLCRLFRSRPQPADRIGGAWCLHAVRRHALSLSCREYANAVECLQRRLQSLLPVRHVCVPAVPAWRSGACRCPANSRLYFSHWLWQFFAWE